MRSFNRVKYHSCGFQPVDYGSAGNEHLVLQWGRGLSTAEIACPLARRHVGEVVASHSAQLTEWGRGLSTAETLMAIVAEPWSAGPIALLAASMGPRSFTLPAETRSFRAGGRRPDQSSRSRASMGPAVFQPRKSERETRASSCNRRGSNGRECFTGASGLSTAEIGVAPGCCGGLMPSASFNWGRGFSTAETRAWPSLPGHALGQSKRCFTGAAWSFNRGNHNTRANRLQLPAENAASMGPRSFNRGNAWCGFVGSRAPVPMRKASMGLAVFQPRKRHPTASLRTDQVHSPGSWCFNGAGRHLSTGGKHGAIDDRGLQGDAADFAASMGPRSFNRGNEDATCPLARSHKLAPQLASMGRAVFQLRKSMPDATSEYPWAPAASNASQASMGPRFFNPAGNLSRRNSTHFGGRRSGTASQWGRGLS